MKIAVIGAGITGITTAYYLAKEGFEVSVFEQEKYPAMRTSYANGGQVSVSNSEVWTTWSNVLKGIRWMFQKDAPLLIRPSLEISKLKWMFRFLKHTINQDYGRNTIDTIKMGLESRKLYKEIIKEENLEFDQSNCGILHFYKDRYYFSNARSVRELYEENGCEWQILNNTEVYDIDPALSRINGVIGGAWTPSDWTGDIHKFCQALSKVLEEKYNVEFYFGLPLENISEVHQYDNFDKVVVSAGVGSVKLAKSIKEELPIYPVKGYSITINVEADQQHLVPKVSLLDDQAKIVTSTLGNRFRVAGTAELAGENYDIRRDRIEPLLKWVHTNFPKLNTSNYSSWACLRPMTPNMMPIVKQSDKDINVWYNTGHGHLGWTLAPYTAKQISKQLGGFYE
jgi:D-amino-acid dehydrogenase